MPFFSIILPTYNRAGFLPETIKSVLAQTFTDWELIIIDDGSTDNTKSVVESFIKNDSRIKYLWQENAERSAARNHGIRLAKGEYICFLDSDDYYTLNYLQKLNSLLLRKEKPIALIVCAFATWDGLKETPVIHPKPNENVANWLFTFPVSPSRACIHKEVTKKYQFREDIVVVEDSVLWVSITNDYPVIYLPEPLVWYRVHDGNSVNRATRAAFPRLAGLRLFFKDPLSDIVSKKHKKELIADVKLRIAEYYYVHKSFLKSLYFLIDSLISVPYHKHTKMKIFFLLNFIPGFKKIWPLIR